jgi:hypothetical protein
VGVTPSEVILRRQVLCLNNLSRFHELDVVVRAEAEIYLFEKELEKVASVAGSLFSQAKTAVIPRMKRPSAPPVVNATEITSMPR